LPEYRLAYYPTAKDGLNKENSMPERNQPVHPLGSRARVLLASVFGPYARDDEYGSRKINPMELYQNQVTRVQGGFSLRMFHRSFGLMMIQNNLDAPCTLLDFPTLEGFTAEITENSYDIIGIRRHHPEYRQGPEDVQTDPAAPAHRNDRHRRPYQQQGRSQ
jgi:hypothetical protein